MSELALKVLERWGLPTVVALGLGALLYLESRSSQEERAAHTALVIDQISDLREKVARAESACTVHDARPPR